MKHIIDLTGENFDRIDFCEAKMIDLFIPYDMPEMLEFSVWGAMLLLAPYWNHRVDFLPSHIKREDQYVYGIGTVKITGVVGGGVEIYPYENNSDLCNRMICAKNKDGTDLIFKHQWESTQLGTEYVWECVTIWPYGFCRLSILSQGSISYEFNDKNLIMSDEYIANPKKYSFHIRK